MSDDDSINKELNPSHYLKYSYVDFIKIIRNYINLLEGYQTIGNFTKKIITKDDITVINNLLNEILLYLSYLSSYPLLQIEFFQLFQFGIKILDLLKTFKLQKDILLYQKITRIKFLKIQQKCLIIKGTEEDCQKAEKIIDDMISIQKERDVFKLMTNVNIADFIFLKAQCKLNQNDVYSAIDLTNEALNYINDHLQENETEFQEKKRIELICKMLNFLAELYDLLKEYIIY